MTEKIDTSNINNYHILQITDNEINDREPDISGNNIVWTAGTSTDSEIFLFDGNQIQQITQDEEPDTEPKISGNNIFWIKSTSDNDYLYFYDGTQTVELSDHDAIYGIRDLSISGSNAVWMAGISAYHLQDIYFFKGDQILELGANDFDDWDPVISDDGEQVAWEAHDYRTYGRAYYGIRLYDGNSTQVITTNIPDNYPIFSGNKLFWFNGVDGIYSYDGNNTTLIDDYTDSPLGLQASENNLVWYSNESEDGGADHEIYLLSTSENEPIVQLTDNLFDDKNPQTSGNNIVWQGSDGNDAEIFVYDGNDIIQLTNNDVDDTNPVIDGDSIAWQSDDGDDTEIFLATLDTTTVGGDDSTTGEDNSSNNDSLNTVYRFFNNDTGVHFYTANEVEKDAVQELDNFSFEGASYLGVDPLTGQPEPVPVYRFLNQDTGVHLYTISEIERDVVQELDNFSFEGEAFFAYESEVEGSIPIYRFFNATTGAHFYTPSAAERDNVEANLPDFQSEGIAYYALSPELAEI